MRAHAGSRRCGALAFIALLGGCAFDPLPGPGVAPGEPCAADRQCASGLCVGERADSPGACGVCGVNLGCAAGARCDLARGACVPEVPGGTVHARGPRGVRRESAEGRVHVGRVGVVPVSTEVSR
jgi:hypothetical protein